MQLHSMIELQLLEALDSEQARIMLPYRDILAFKSLLGFCKIPAHVGWQLLKQRVEKLSVADRVILVRELVRAEVLLGESVCGRRLRCRFFVALALARS